MFLIIIVYIRYLSLLIVHQDKNVPLIYFSPLFFLSSSPLKVKEDDEVDNLDINLDVKKKSKRVYQSPSPKVGLKISRSLKVSRMLESYLTSFYTKHWPTLYTTYN